MYRLSPPPSLALSYLNYQRRDLRKPSVGALEQRRTQCRHPVLVCAHPAQLHDQALPKPLLTQPFHPWHTAGEPAKLSQPRIKTNDHPRNLCS